MLTLVAKVREILRKKVKALRKKGILPGILYGPKIKQSLPLQLDYKSFEKVYKKAGKISLIKLQLQEGKQKITEYTVLIHVVKKDPISGEFLHVDFYQPRLEEEVQVTVPLIFEGEAPAVKDLEGTLVKVISEIEVKALPQNLPKEIKVNIENLKTFEDNILIKDLKLPEGVEVLKEPQEIVASVFPPKKIEEELEKPIEEKVEEIEKVEEKKEEKKEEEKEKK